MIRARLDSSNRLTVIAADIVAAHNEAQEYEAKAMQRAITAGELLTEAKATLKHGEWLPWLKEHISFSERTARNYMRLAEEAKRQRLPISDMGVKEALRLLADIDSIPLPQQNQHTVGIVSEFLWDEIDDFPLMGTDLVEIWTSVQQPDPAACPADYQPPFYHVLYIGDGFVWTTRKPRPGIHVHRTLQFMAYPLHQAKWKVFDGRKDEAWKSLMEMNNRPEFPGDIHQLIL